MYVARDKDGALFLFMNMPKRSSIWECWQSENRTTDYFRLSPKLFPDVKWEDEEPTKVELVKSRIQRHKSMCINDKTKVCNLCHECDVDVLNPSY